MTSLQALLFYGSGICILISVILILLVMLREANIFIKLLCTEVLSNVFIIGVGVFSLKKNMYFLLDVGIVVALLVFLTTLAFCSLQEKRELIDV